MSLSFSTIRAQKWMTANCVFWERKSEHINRNNQGKCTETMTNYIRAISVLRQKPKWENFLSKCVYIPLYISFNWGLKQRTNKRSGIESIPVFSMVVDAKADEDNCGHGGYRDVCRKHRRFLSEIYLTFASSRERKSTFFINYKIEQSSMIWIDFWTLNRHAPRMSTFCAKAAPDRN
jgi:hypothetical protein